MSPSPMPRPRPGRRANVTYRQPADVELWAWIDAVREVETSCPPPPGLWDRPAWIRQVDGFSHPADPPGITYYRA